MTPNRQAAKPEVNPGFSKPARLCSSFFLLHYLDCCDREHMDHCFLNEQMLDLVIQRNLVLGKIARVIINAASRFCPHIICGIDYITCRHRWECFYLLLFFLYQYKIAKPIFYLICTKKKLPTKQVINPSKKESGFHQNLRGKFALFCQ